MAKLLDEKVAIVTGASRGLGLAIATALAVDGAKVLMVSRNEEELAEAATGIREAVFEGTGEGGTSDGSSVAFLAADLAAGLDDEGGGSAADQLVTRAIAEFGRLDIVVNNAGVFVWKPFLDLEVGDWSRTIDTNLSAACRLTQVAAKSMADQGTGGSIVNIASIHGLVGDGNVVPHCASKFGLIGLTKAAAEALRQHEIRVNAVAPGQIAPESASVRGTGPQDKVTQADIASMIVYLSSHLSKTVTGAVVEMNGATRSVIK